LETALLAALVRSVSPKVMIEFGCNEGRTAARMLENVPTLEKYIGIDVPPDFETTLACQRTEVPKDAGFWASGDPRFFLLLQRSRDLRDGDLEDVDAVFIDGDHSEAAVLHESRLAFRLLRRPGIIVWHDYQNPAVEVTTALNWLAIEGWPISYVENSWIAFMRVEDTHHAAAKAA
jgi:predicted O-methyltransferase YrrM